MDEIQIQKHEDSLLAEHGVPSIYVSHLRVFHEVFCFHDPLCHIEPKCFHVVSPCVTGAKKVGALYFFNL